MPAALSIAIVLAAVLAGGAVATMVVRRWRRRTADDRADWERTLVEWRNLRDEGVLTEEEFRKVRTLVEPRTRIGMPDPRSRPRPAAGTSGPDHERT